MINLTHFCRRKMRIKNINTSSHWVCIVSHKSVNSIASCEDTPNESQYDFKYKSNTSNTEIFLQCCEFRKKMCFILPFEMEFTVSILSCWLPKYNETLDEKKSYDVDVIIIAGSYLRGFPVLVHTAGTKFRGIFYS